MSVKIDIPSYLQPYTGGMQVVEAEGCAVGACLQYLDQDSPQGRHDLHIICDWWGVKWQ